MSLVDDGTYVHLGNTSTVCPPPQSKEGDVRVTDELLLALAEAMCHFGGPNLCVILGCEAEIQVCAMMMLMMTMIDHWVLMMMLMMMTMIDH